MQSLARPGYTEAQVREQLHMVDGSRTVGFRYELLSGLNKTVRSLDTVLSCSIGMESARAVPRIARLTMREDDQPITFQSQRIKPYYRLKMPDGAWVEWPLGVFLLTTPKRSTTPADGVVLDLEAYDTTLVYSDDLVDDRYVVESGTNYVDAVLAVLGDQVRVDVVDPTTKTLPVTREWPIGTSKLQIVAELLQAIGYAPLHFDEDGRAVVKAYQLPDVRSPEYTYADDETSVILPGAQQSIDLNTPNTFIRYVSDPERAVLRKVVVNANPNSPTSTVSVGRTISSFEQVEAADQESLDLITEQAAFAASQVTDEISFSTAVMPHHSHDDVFDLFYGKLGVAFKYNEVGWSLPLEPGGTMTHSLRRVISVS